LFSGVRFLHDSNRNMPLKVILIWRFEKPMPMVFELRGKTLGIVGIGRIGQATAKMALRYESHCCG
jgi:D-3-phosphoglycerate dehydrogenase